MEIQVPQFYERFIKANSDLVINGLPLYSEIESEDGFDMISANEFLSLSIPSIANEFIVIRYLDDSALLIKKNPVDAKDGELYEFDLIKMSDPKIIHPSFNDYINHGIKRKREIAGALRKIDNLFNANQINRYEHKAKSKKSSVPFKARDWRLIRSCVHDVVIGLAAFKHNEIFNCLEVDVFISTDHPDYEKGHGIRALTSSLLSDAYRNGTSMEMRFTRYDGKKNKRIEARIPDQLVQFFKENKIILSQAGEGLISHSEAVSLYSKIIGLDNKVIEKIKVFENQDRLSVQGVCYLIASGIWTLDETSWILLNSPRPEGILFGKDTPEMRFSYEESLNWGKAALAITKLRHKIENSLTNEGDTTTRIDHFIQHITAHQSANIDWALTTPTITIEKGEEITVLARPRRFYPSPKVLVNEDIRLLSDNQSKNKKFLLYNEEFLKVKGCDKLAMTFTKSNNIDVLILPFSSNELEEEISNRMRRSRMIRT